MYPEKKPTWRFMAAGKDAPLRMVDHRFHSKDPNSDVTFGVEWAKQYGRRPTVVSLVASL